MNDYRILHGDALTRLRTLPDSCVHCVVTSPPYYGLRDYGTATWLGGDPACEHKGPPMRTTAGLCDGWESLTGTVPAHLKAAEKRAPYRQTCGKCGATRQDDQIGLEPTVEDYVARLVEVFEEVRRVLRDDGTLWLNLGDSYFGGKGSNGNSKARRTASARGYKQSGGTAQMDTRPLDMPQDGMKPKDLIGIPWRVALALQAAGWWLRADIIWAKRAPMPESVTDRPTRSHEHIFLLTKRDRYFYDAEAVKEGLSDSTLADKRNGTGRHTQGINYSKYYDEESPDPEKADKPSWYRQKTFVNPQTGRNMRDVWHLSPEPYPEAHFATFPTEIPRRAILAGTSERGCCPACGAPWERVTERQFVKHPNGLGNGTETKDLQTHQRGTTSSFRTGGSNVAHTTGWRQTCACPPADPIPCTVLDPFGGSGTTVAVAVGLGRHGIGIELNQDYIILAEKRIRETQRPLL